MLTHISKTSKISSSIWEKKKPNTKGKATAIPYNLILLCDLLWNMGPSILHLMYHLLSENSTHCTASNTATCHPNSAGYTLASNWANLLDRVLAKPILCSCQKGKFSFSCTQELSRKWEHNLAFLSCSLYHWVYLFLRGTWLTPEGATINQE